MITGDYPETARAIAAEAGIASGDLMTGGELERMGDAELRRRIGDTAIFARIMPEQKLRIVEALKANGEIVAMTGDGVNDAPSLKAAHIGIAMGGRGTDVAREAAALVLLDDDFGSIVEAVRLGRRIYDNLRKSMAYILAVHVPIAGLAVLPLLFGLPLIFSPLHIAFLEMVIDPVSSHNADVTGTLHVLWASKEAGVKRVVYAASSSAYGDSAKLPKQEDMPVNPISPYGLMKYVGEEYCRIFTSLYGLETVSLRYFNVFGPHQDPTSQYSGVLSRFITAMLTGKRPVIFGDGEQSRDFTYVSNVVSVNLLACHSPKASGRVYNVACGAQVSLNQVVDILNRILGSKLSAAYEPSRAGDIRHSLADIGRAKADLAYVPSVGFEEGLKKTVEWYREYLETTTH
jgi:nucleoside-diphosphate-sugar epimerase/soluble P-type ATPase